MGNATSQTDSLMGTWGYTYDALNRLLTATASAGTYAGLTLTESYDAYGNRENQVPSGTYGGPVPSASLLTFTGVHNCMQAGQNNNTVDQWSYDCAGDVLNDGTNMYEYDAEGRQTGTYNTLNGLTGYVYNAEGNRVMKVVVNGFGTPHPTTTVTKEYLLGPNGEQISVLDGSGTWQWTNVYAGGRQLATYDSAGTHFTLTDWLGTKRMQLSVTAASTVTVGERCASLPYGDGLNCTGSDVNHLYFTGKQRDTESGNDYFLARYFSSDSGRFLTPDWSKNPQGVPYADYTNPQSLNLYQYVGNNPLSRADKDGHCPWCWDLVVNVGTYVGTFIGSHPGVANAIDKVGNSLGIKMSLGVGAGGNVGTAGLEGAATGYLSVSPEGIGAGGQLSGSARVGSVGAEERVNVPVVKDGQTVNPLTNATVSGSATLTKGKASVSGSVTGQETTVGGTYGEGVVGGVEVSAGTKELKGVARAVGDAVASDTRQYVHDLKESTTCNGGTCATPH